MDNTAPVQIVRALLRPRAALLAALVALGFASSSSAMILMKIEGIDGESVVEGHEKWIDVTSLQWGLGRAVTTPTGGAADRETSTPSFSDVVTAKLADKTTVALFREAAADEGKTVEFHFIRTGSLGRIEVYQKIELSNTLISGFSQSSGGDRPSESLSLNYTKIKVSVIRPGEPDDIFTFDLATGKGS